MNNDIASVTSSLSDWGSLGECSEGSVIRQPAPIEEVVASLLCDHLDQEQRCSLLGLLEGVHQFTAVYVDNDRLSQELMEKIATVAEQLLNTPLMHSDLWREVDLLSCATGMQCFLAHTIICCHNRWQVADGYEIFMARDGTETLVTPAISKAGWKAEHDQCAVILGELGIAPHCMYRDDKMIVMHKASHRLSDYMQTGEGVTGQTVAICAGIAAQMERMHALNLIHQDLSPRNIILNLTYKDCPVIKLIDFESTRFVGECARAVESTKLLLHLAHILQQADDNQKRQAAMQWGVQEAAALEGRLLSEYTDDEAHTSASSDRSAQAKLLQLERSRCLEHLEAWRPLISACSEKGCSKNASHVLDMVYDLRNKILPVALPVNDPLFAAPEFGQFIQTMHALLRGDVTEVSIPDLQKHDVWSLGIIMLGMLQGTADCICEDVCAEQHLKYIAAVINQLNNSPNVLKNPHAAFLLQLVNQILVVDHEQRPSMAEVAYQLESYGAIHL